MYRALLIASREEVNSMDFYSRDLCLSIRSDGWRCCASHLSPASSQLGVEKALRAGKLQPFHASPAPGGFVLGHEALSLSPFPAACPGSQLWVVLGPSSSTSGLSLSPAGETEARLVTFPSTCMASAHPQILPLISQGERGTGGIRNGISGM